MTHIRDASVRRWRLPASGSPATVGPEQQYSSIFTYSRHAIMDTPAHRRAGNHLGWTHSLECREAGRMEVISWNLTRRLRHIPLQVEMRGDQSGLVCSLHKYCTPDGGLVPLRHSIDHARYPSVSPI